MKLNFKIEKRDFSKAGYASSEVKKILKKLNLPASVVRKIAITLYEGEVNIVAHSEGGEMNTQIFGDRIETVLSDCGPGIPDIDQAMVQGFSTASQEVRNMGFGAGMGLPNMKKNADKLTVESEVGKGTTVTIVSYFADQPA